jgi:phosphate transport system permease protein
MGFDGKSKTRNPNRDDAPKEVSETVGFGFTFEDFKPILVKIADYFKRFFSAEGFTAICAFSSLIITGLILFFLFQQSYPIFNKLGYGTYTIYYLYYLQELGYPDIADGIVYSGLWSGGNILGGFFNFITGSSWSPADVAGSGTFGILPLIESTFIVVGGAMAIAIPIGVFSAIHLAEYCSLKVKTVLKTMIEMLAGIPSVIFGLVGLYVIVPYIKNLFNLNTGLTALAASIVLSIMLLPTIVSVSEDAISAVPGELKEASFALGATHFQTVRKVIVPAAAAGIAAAIVLAIGRAVGETMAVLMVAGNVPFSFAIPWYYYLMPISNQVTGVLGQLFLRPVYPMTATIASLIMEAPWGGSEYQALIAIGFVLFVITYIINFASERIIFRFSKKLKRGF